MDILYLLIPLSLVLVFVIAVFFWWSLRTNQYDDLDGPGYRILMDDDGGASPAGPQDRPGIGRGESGTVLHPPNPKDI